MQLLADQCVQAEVLLAPFQFEHVIADKTYDADRLLEAIAHKKVALIIPLAKIALKNTVWQKSLQET